MGYRIESVDQPGNNIGDHTDSNQQDDLADGMIDQLFTFALNIVNGFNELGQKIFQTIRTDQAVGGLSQLREFIGCETHFHNGRLVVGDVKGLRIARTARRVADAELISE